MTVDVAKKKSKWETVTSLHNHCWWKLFVSDIPTIMCQTYKFKKTRKPLLHCFHLVSVLPVFMLHLTLRKTRQLTLSVGLWPLATLPHTAQTCWSSPGPCLPCVVGCHEWPTPDSAVCPCLSPTLWSWTWFGPSGPESAPTSLSPPAGNGTFRSRSLELPGWQERRISRRHGKSLSLTHTLM